MKSNTIQRLEKLRRESQAKQEKLKQKLIEKFNKER